MVLFARSRAIPALLSAMFLTAANPAHAASANEKCAPCHPSITRSYAVTAMAKSSGAIPARGFFESLRQSRFTNESGTADYTIAAKPDGLHFSVRQGDATADRRLDYFIGSGAVGRSYLTRIDEFLFQSPASYYSIGAQWQISPGYQRSEEVNLTRPVESSCLNCHASRIQPTPGTRNGYAAQPFLDDGIGCERCHGPGDRHIAQMKNGVKIPRAIVNPAKLDPPRRDSVCAQCHLAGEVRIAKLTQREPYQPGDLLSDHTAVFLWSSGPASLRVNGHFEGLAQSRCKQVSGDKLWCGSCHDPHRQPSPAQRATYYREKCLTCHATHPCNASLSERNQVHDDCASCHMPRAAVHDVQHATFTDHSIRRSAARDLQSAETRPSLIAFGGEEVSNRDAGLAYAFVALRDNDRGLGAKAFELLKAANLERPSDPKVSSQLAQLYDRMGDEETACALYERAAEDDPDSIAPAINHGSCLARRGRVRESIAIWTAVLRRSPGEEDARLNLAVALHRSGDGALALVNLREALRFNPLSAKARQLLNEIAALQK